MLRLLLNYALITTASLLLPLSPGFAQPPLPSDPVEQQVAAFLDAAAQADWEQADGILQKLRKQHPDFRAVSVLQTINRQRGSIDLARPADIAPETDENLDTNLQAELYMRWQYRLNPAPDRHYPKSIIQLGNHQPYVFVVDQARSRLYLFSNENGELNKLADYYSGIGKQGVGKQIRGDHRTPVGIYTITEYIPDNKLPDLYGSGALPIDYPNAWDRRLKRTGSGIWLHGVPRAVYSRTPRSSRGCVTVSNFVFDALRHYTVLEQTPMILADRIDWQTPEHAAQQREFFHALLEQWRQEQIKATSTEMRLQDVDMFFYPGEDNLVQMNFKQFSGNSETVKESARTLFWQPDAENRWRVIYKN